MFSLIRKTREDRGDSSVVSLLFLIPLFVVIAVSAVDFWIVQKNTAAVESITREAAATVGILGGNTPNELSKGTTTTEGAYLSPGVGMQNECTEASTPTECSIIDRIKAMDGKGIGNIVVKNVRCGPGYTTDIGQPTFCEVEWRTSPVPMSFRAFSMNADAPQNMLVCGTGQSEVALKPGDELSTETCATSAA